MGADGTQKTAGESKRHLSEHFHRVRLTSITVSLVLFVLCLPRVHGPEKISVFGWGLAAPDEYFLRLMLLVAAIVSFGHLIVLWLSEKDEFALRELSKLTNLSETVNSARQHIDTACSTLTEMAVRADQLLKSSELENRIPLLDRRQIQEEYGHLWNDDVADRLAGSLQKNFSLNLGAMMPSNPEFELSLQFEQEVDKVLMDFAQARMDGEALSQFLSIDVRKEVTDKVKEVCRTFVYATRPAPNQIDDIVSIAIDTEVRPVIQQKVQAVASLTRIMQNDEASVESNIVSAKHVHHEGLRTAVIALGDARSDTTTLRRALNKSTLLVRAQIGAIDIGVPALMFILAIAHAAGRLFLSLLPSAPALVALIRNIG